MAYDSHLVLDIETVPDRSVYTPPAPQPGAERAFPPLYACKVVVIGVMWLDAELRVKRHGTIADGKDEAKVLHDFSDFMNRHRPNIVTWNGRGFDLPVLVLRALHHGVTFPWYYQGRDVRYRFSEQGHLDLCDHLADHGAGARTPLAGAAALIGLPGKDGIDGSQVEGLYNAGHLDELRAYCLSDVAQTALLFMRYRLLAGHIDHATYRKAAADLLDALAADPRLDRLVAAIDRKSLLLGDQARGGETEAAGDGAIAD